MLEEMDMLIILSLHVVFVYRNTTLYPVNMYNYYVPIKNKISCVRYGWSIWQLAIWLFIGKLT
jgi:hypothetical protein